MNFLTLFNALPGACAQGLIWGIMAIGVYITYKILDYADLTTEGSFGFGAVISVLVALNGHPILALFAGITAYDMQKSLQLYHRASSNKEMLEKINSLGIGPGGLGGTTTALAVNINTYPTHIAGLPVAVNICCHVNRHVIREI